MENKKIYTPVEVELKNNLMFLKSLNKPFNGTVEYPIDKTSTVKVPYKDGIQHGKKYEIFKNNFNIHHWDNGQLILSEFYIENICYLKKIYNGKVLIEQHFSYERPEPQYNLLITEEKYVLDKKNTYKKEGFWQEQHSPTSSYFTRGEYHKGERVGLWIWYKNRRKTKKKYSSSDFLKLDLGSLELKFYKKNKTFCMSFSNYKYGNSKNIIVGIELNGKPNGWWYWLSLKKLSYFFEDKKYYGNTLEKLWQFWDLKSKKDIPKEISEFINKKVYY